MSAVIRRLAIVLLVLAPGGCESSDPAAMPTMSGGESTGDDGGGVVTTLGMTGMMEGGNSVGDTAGDSDDGTDGVSSSEGDGMLFVVGDDIIYPPSCNIFDNDCPPGEKCMVYAQGGGSWNATACFPIAEDPDAVGEPCTASGSGASGLDTCEAGAICWNVDPRTLDGTCVAYCGGSEANPTCTEACTHCAINSGPLALCLTACDPMAQDCPEGQACYPVNQEFACVPDVSGLDGAAGDPCEFINVCDPGSFCLNGELWPDCESDGCCVPVCDLAAADPCPGAPAGVECTAWYEDGQTPPNDGCALYESIGVCTLPPP